jgi:hypothetical protein
MRTIDRRDFLGTSAKIIAAASIFPLYSFPNDGKPASATKTKLALVGTGSRGTYTWGKNFPFGCARSSG